MQNQIKYAEEEFLHEEKNTYSNNGGDGAPDRVRRTGKDSEEGIERLLHGERKWQAQGERAG